MANFSEGFMFLCINHMRQSRNEKGALFIANSSKIQSTNGLFLSLFCCWLWMYNALLRSDWFFV